jgi:hypothetical protein
VTQVASAVFIKRGIPALSRKAIQHMPILFLKGSMG